MRNGNNYFLLECEPYVTLCQHGWLKSHCNQSGLSKGCLTQWLLDPSPELVKYMTKCQITGLIPKFTQYCSFSLKDFKVENNPWDVWLWRALCNAESQSWWEIELEPPPAVRGSLFGGLVWGWLVWSKLCWKSLNKVWWTGISLLLETKNEAGTSYLWPLLPLCQEGVCYCLHLECPLRAHMWTAWSPTCGTTGRWQNLGGGEEGKLRHWGSGLEEVLGHWTFLFFTSLPSSPLVPSFLLFFHPPRSFQADVRWAVSLITCLRHAMMYCPAIWTETFSIWVKKTLALF